jgi:tetratricopeptide (TPR) repeat protein
MSASRLLLSLVIGCCCSPPPTLRSQTEFNDATAHHPAERVFNEKMNQPAEPTDYEILVQQAVGAILASHWAEAFKTLNQAIALDPGRPEAYLNYGRAHFIRNEYAYAERAFLKAQEVDPDFAAAWFEYAKLMVLKGEAVIAFESANKAVVLSEYREWKYLVLLAELSARRGDRLGTELAFDQAIEILQQRRDRMDRAITDEEMKTDIREIFHDVELVGNIGGGMTEVPVTRIETEGRIAPDSWLAMRNRLKDKISELETRKAETLTSIPP